MEIPEVIEIVDDKVVIDVDILDELVFESVNIDLELRKLGYTYTAANSADVNITLQKKDKAIKALEDNQSNDVDIVDELMYAVHRIDLSLFKQGYVPLASADACVNKLLESKVKAFKAAVNYAKG